MTTKWTRTTPKFVQLQANCMVDGCVEPAQHRGEVEFYSIYLGEPGNYQWVADFECHTAALRAAHHMVMAFGCEIDRSQYDAVMRTLAPVPQPKGHPYAALMAEYAKDAAETDKPWERWEIQVSGPWEPMVDHPRWVSGKQYRRKPEPPKKVNGFEVPAPLQSAGPDVEVWLPSLTNSDFALDFRCSELGRSWFARGIVHATKEAAVAHAKAMLGIDPSK